MTAGKAGGTLCSRPKHVQRTLSQIKPEKWLNTLFQQTVTLATIYIHNLNLFTQENDSSFELK